MSDQPNPTKTAIQQIADEASEEMGVPNVRALLDSIPSVPWWELPAGISINRPLTKAEAKACSRGMAEVAVMFRQAAREGQP